MPDPSCPRGEAMQLFEPSGTTCN